MPTWCQKYIRWHGLLRGLYNYLVLRTIYGYISFYSRKITLLQQYFPVSNNSSRSAHKPFCQVFSPYLPQFFCWAAKFPSWELPLPQLSQLGL